MTGGQHIRSTCDLGSLLFETGSNGVQLSLDNLIPESLYSRVRLLGLARKAHREDIDHWKHGLCGAVGGEIFAEGAA